MCERFLEIRDMESRALSAIFDSEIMKEFPIKDLVLMQMEDKLIGNLKIF